jgi:phage FluMu protein Com
MEHQLPNNDPLSELKNDDSKPRDFYRELRCNSCRLLICYEYIFDGYIEFTCPRCREISTFHFKHRKNAKNINA